MMKQVETRQMGKGFWDGRGDLARHFDLRQLLMCILAVVSSRFRIAEACPFVPGIYMAGFLAGMNRSVLFLCTLGGLTILAPIQTVVRYGGIILAVTLIAKVLEWSVSGGSVWMLSLLSGVVTAAAVFTGIALQLPEMGTWQQGVLEGIFVCGFVYAGTRLCFLFLDWTPGYSDPIPVVVQGGDRLREYAASFEQLSRTFQQMKRYKSDFSEEELDKMQHEVTGNLCVACHQCSYCWEGEQTLMHSVLYRFLQSLTHGEDIDQSSRELGEHCVYKEDMVAQVLRVFEKAHLNMAWYNRLQENRDVVAQQLEAMAYVLEDCAKDEQDVTKNEGAMRSAIRYACREKGIQCEHIRILMRTNGKYQIFLKGKMRGKTCASVRELARTISRICDRTFTPAGNSKALIGENSTEITFVENSRYTAAFGVARAVQDHEVISGDSFSFQTLDSGKCILCISDGMGSGSLACKESEMVIDLIEKFMEAGFLPGIALRMMNSAMVTHADRDMFSTVDLVTVDLDTGLAEFYKVGASASFIRHGDEITCVEEGSLPVGVFTHQDPVLMTDRLQEGDWVVMVTDGVLDHLNTADPKAAVAEIIRGIRTQNPTQFAREILEQVQMFTDGYVRDDMTVLAAGFWKNEKTK